MFLDPDGSAPDWAHLVIEWPSNVLYQHQYGGTANRQGEVEGYLVPVDVAEARPLLDDVFLRRLKGAGSWGKDLEPDLLECVRRAVGTIQFWPDTEGAPAREPLTLDESRLHQLDEAWIPVETSDGPGVLVWNNSD